MVISTRFKVASVIVTVAFLITSFSVPVVLADDGEEDSSKAKEFTYYSTGEQTLYRPIREDNRGEIQVGALRCFLYKRRWSYPPNNPKLWLPWILVSVLILLLKLIWQCNPARPWNSSFGVFVNAFFSKDSFSILLPEEQKTNQESRLEARLITSKSRREKHNWS